MPNEKKFRVWNDWEFEKELGKGAYGVVYKAVRDGEEAAIKVISIPADVSEVNSLRAEGMTEAQTKEYFKGITDDFKREIQLLKRFEGLNNIVSIEDHKVFEKEDEIGWDIYIRMQLLTPLRDYMLQKPMSQDDVIDFGVEMCEALELCYKEQIIHRDIKPENIFVDSFGNYKLGDFGIARKLENATNSMSSKGTLNYIAPEVYYGGKYDQRVDIYSLGIVLYVLMNDNKMPFLNAQNYMNHAARAQAQERRMQGERLPKPCNASDEMASVIMCACAYDPEKRFFTPTAMKNALLNLKKGFVKGAAVADDVERTRKVNGAGGAIADAEAVGNGTWIGRQPDGNNGFGGAISADERKEKSVKKEKSGSKRLIAILAVLALIVVIILILMFSCDGSGGKGGSDSDTTTSTTSSSDNLTTTEPTTKPTTKPSSDTQEDAGNEGELDFDKIVMHNFVGMPYETAREEAELASIKLNVKKEYDNEVEENYVVSQSVKEGVTLSQDEVVDIVVSLGPENVKVPNVVGFNEDKARQTMTDSGLEVIVTYKITDDATPDNVISQAPVADSQAKYGDRVEIVVAKENEKVTVPNVVGKSESDATIMLNNNGLNVKIEYAFDNSVEKGKAISQSPSAGTQQKVGSAVTIKVSKGKQSFTVTLDANGGSVSSNSVSVVTGSTYGTLPTPSKAGYNFDGWYTTSSGGSKVTSSTKVTATSAHTLYARWSAKKATVTFNANGGSVSTSSKSVTYNSTYGELPTPTRTGYTFSGWYTASSGGSKVTSSTKVETTSTHTLYARWTAKTITVTFNANGGSVSTSSKSVTYNSTYGSLPTPTRDYYTFDGWYTASSGGTRITSSSTVSATSSQTLYAHWTINDAVWAHESAVPSGAQIVEEKWTYTRTQNTESTSSSMSGWTQTGSYWSKTSSGSFEYSDKFSTYAPGFDTSHSIYSMAKSPYTAYENESTKRTVSNSWTGYIYWHWMYDCNSSSAGDRVIYYQKGRGTSSATGNDYGYKYFGAFKSSTNYTRVTHSYTQNTTYYKWYKVTDRSSYSLSQGSLYWYRFDYYTCSYTDYQKIYQYQKVTTGIESSTYVTAGGEISNVQRYVRYRAK